MDIPLIYVSEVGDGDAEKRKQFVMQTGILSSALEHATPEQMFTSQDPADPKPDAISAVKALQKASAAGQRIYHLTQENMGSTLGAIHHDTATILEIRSALLAGKEVITHTNSVSVPGWSGAGYIILDPDTGVGAYKISGGMNGGYLVAFAFFLAFVAAIGILLSASAFFLVSVALVAIAAALIDFFLTTNTCGDARDDVNLAINLSAAIVGAMVGLLGKVGATISTAIVSWLVSSGATAAISNSCD